MNALTQSTSWKALVALAAAHQVPWTQPQSADRPKCIASACHIHLNFSSQPMTDQAFNLLIALAESVQLRDKIEALMAGEPVNVSEQKPALHTALRETEHASILVQGHEVIQDILAARHTMYDIAETIRNKGWLGFSEKPITDLVHIGIGGSDLGPRLALQALKADVTDHLGYHFISDADPTSFNRAVDSLNPETTLFIVASKSFSTEETLYNAHKALAWIGPHSRRSQHFIAVTAHTKKAQQLGFTTILPLWDFVGGRYSFCSAVNIITAIAIGSHRFNELLDGAHQMDLHYKTTDFKSNLPVLLALIGLWNNNFLHIHQLLTLVYTQQLDYFVPYLQQLDMESNGKSLDLQGNSVHYATGPILWGGSGNQAQHSYYQLLCQGTHKVAVDLFSLRRLDGELINDLCHANMATLTKGVHHPDHPNGFIPGNTPLNHLELDALTPFTLGALVALYEHKIYTQSVLWNINPFDQPGVESAKASKQRAVLLS